MHGSRSATSAQLRAQQTSVVAGRGAASAASCELWRMAVACLGQGGLAEALEPPTQDSWVLGGLYSYLALKQGPGRCLLLHGVWFRCALCEQRITVACGACSLPTVGPRADRYRTQMCSRTKNVPTARARWPRGARPITMSEAQATHLPPACCSVPQLRGLTSLQKTGGRW